MNIQIITENQNNSLIYEMNDQLNEESVDNSEQNWWQHLFDRNNILENVSTHEIVFRSVGTFICILIILLTLVGNILVIVVVTRFHRMRTVTNILLARYVILILLKERPFVICWVKHNLLLIYSITYNKWQDKTRSAQPKSLNLLIGDNSFHSLAFSDITVACLVMPFTIIYDFIRYWPWGTVACHFWISCDVMCCTASILHLCCVAIDRYVKI